MAGRGAGQNAAFMQVMTEALQNMSVNLQILNEKAHHNQPQGHPEYRGLDEFCRRNPTQFVGGFAPDAANEWIQELERIFRAMMCTEEQKVVYATYMLTKEAEAWWGNTKQVMIHEEQAINWDSFKERFLRKYFPADMRTKKEMEFLRLEQGNMSVGEYAARFEELSKYAPQYNAVGNERSKCAKFEDGLRHDLKVVFSHQEIQDFATLVNKCRLYEDSVKARDAATKAVVQSQKNFGPQRRNDDNRNRGHGFHNNRGPYHPDGGRRANRFGGLRPQGTQVYNNNNDNFHNNHNNNGNNNNSGYQVGGTPPLCARCNRNHFGNICPGPRGNCFHCNQPGHFKNGCPKLKQEEMNAVNASRSKTKGIVFAMCGEKATSAKNLIQGMHLDNEILLSVIFSRPEDSQSSMRESYPHLFETDTLHPYSFFEDEKFISWGGL